MEEHLHQQPLADTDTRQSKMVLLNLLPYKRFAIPNRCSYNPTRTRSLNPPSAENEARPTHSILAPLRTNERDGCDSSGMLSSLLSRTAQERSGGGRRGSGSCFRSPRVGWGEGSRQIVRATLIHELTSATRCSLWRSCYTARRHSW
jgi:hypothetical protein